MTRFGTRSARSARHLNDKSDYVNHRGDVPLIAMQFVIESLSYVDVTRN